MKNYKIISCAFIVALTIAFPFKLSLAFSDVQVSDWFYETVSKAKSENWISGYPDNTFKPYASVTEAEFATMLAGFLDDESLKIARSDVQLGIYEGHWSQPVYNKFLVYAMPFKGYFNDDSKDRALTRSEVAISLCAIKGLNLDERQAVYFLYQNGLSKGENSSFMNFETFNPKSNVTRAEIAALLSRMSQKKSFLYKDKTILLSGNEIVGISNVEKRMDPVDFTVFNNAESSVVESLESNRISPEEENSLEKTEPSEQEGIIQTLDSENSIDESSEINPAEQVEPEESVEDIVSPKNLQLENPAENKSESTDSNILKDETSSDYEVESTIPKENVNPSDENQSSE